MRSPLPNSDHYPGARPFTRSRASTKSLTGNFIWTIYVLALILNDAWMTVLAFRLAYIVRFEWSLPIFEKNVFISQPYYSVLSVMLIPVWLATFTVVGLYNRQYLLGGTEEYSLTARATTVSLMIMIIFGFFQPEFIVARGWLFFAWGFSFILVVLGRFILRRLVYLLRRKGLFLSPTVIVGANDEGLSLARQLTNWRTSGLNVVGFVDKKLKPGALVGGEFQILGSVEDLDQIISDYQIEELVMASSAISSRDKLLDIFQQYGVLDDINLRMSSGLYEIITTGLTVKEFAYIPLVGVNKVRLTGANRVIKTLLDYVLTIPGMILVLPIMALISIAIRLDSPGPVLYRRRVMGVNNKQFDAYKFRTMYINGDEILAQYPKLLAEFKKKHKLANDPRVTRVGKLLRKFSLDELPQLLNVLRGEMSLVGPRMISPKEMKNYSQWGLNLLTIKPGLTGLWQVSGRSDVTYEERVSLDMHYIRNYTVWQDLQILFRTIPAVIYGHGAY